ncbi:M48 family metallopeptidase [Acetomicrobium sp.]|jgi:Zn-dependent protease with chaperone function|uniref:M48 family metallopeptidase n=1 Tax=Acetomicrobium sp. TaxID=1872099 RepID=UPI001B5569BC|nr:M48 family metallopeptidase [Acetomicrobium sp.]
MLILYTPIMTYAQEDDSKEIALGRKVAEQVEKTWERVTDPTITARLNMILTHFRPHLERDLPYEVRAIKDDEIPNAFSLPGGIVYFTTGMIQLAESDSELAGVMAHELAHTEKKHVMIQVARNQKLSLLGLGIIVATGGQAAAVLLTNVAQVAIMNSYSRDLEEEADMVGLDLLIKAGYPPSAMITLLERLAEEELKRPYFEPGIYQSHPKLKDRIAYLKSTIMTKGLALNRKEVLGLLRVEVTEEDNFCLLAIDEEVILKLKSNPDTVAVLTHMAAGLNKALKLELEPYEVRIINVGEESFFCVGPDRIISQKDLPAGAPSLEEIRDKILLALEKARQKHTFTNFIR